MLLFRVVVTFCVLGFAYQQQDNDLITTACEITRNETVKAQFFASVREQHGITGNQYDQRYAQTTYQRTHTIPCYGACDDATQDDITWCVNLFNNGQKVELCLNSTWENATAVARTARLLNHFHMPENCGGKGPGCLEVASALYYLNNAYLTCTSETSSCYRKTFVVLLVDVIGYEVEPPVITLPDSPHNITLGERALLQCIVVVRGINVFSAWRRNGEAYGIINEDPTCDNTTEDCKVDIHPEAAELKTHRVRAYQDVKILQNCPVDEVKMTNVLVIDNVTEADNGTYQCTGYMSIPTPWPVLRSSSMFVEVNPVLPLVPVVPQNQTVSLTPDGNVDGPTQWTCTVVGSTQDRLEWVHDGEPVPVVFSNTTQGLNCSTFNLSSPYVTEAEEEESGSYKTRYQLTLHFCNSTERDIGSYHCVLHRWNGVMEPVLEVKLQRATDEVPTPTTPPTSNSTSSPTVATGSSFASAPNPSELPLTIILTCTSASIVILIIVAVILLAVICARKRLRTTTVFSDILFQERPYLPHDYVKKESMVELLPTDPMEFPRAKLHLLNRVLGEGTFGKVVQARAEGIVDGSPERNIVAVKTTKDNPSLQDREDLWDELQLMKGMIPHENILNLLGHCTTPGGPLCLIVEYAIYGNLKGFLRECEQAVRGLNHLPIIARSKSRSLSTTSTSSTYPLLLHHEKTSLSRQNSVFSDTPNECRKFTFPVPPHSKIQDDGAFVESLEAQQTAHAPGMTTPVAHTVSPLAHDYVNSKGLVYMEDVMNFALQIACGLQHLQNMQIVHCDLAARNILIAEGFVLKIADFGMARDVSEKAYYRKRIGGRVPVKWTAPEALESQVFSYNSDIWSFGVVLWEIFSYGRSPFPEFKINVSWEPFIQHLKTGNRLLQPDGCPDFLYNLMLQCWQLNPDERPSARELITTFTPESDNTDSLHSQSSGNSRETTV